MPHRQSTALPRERLAIMTFYVGITRIMRESIAPENSGGDVGTLIYVWAGVHIGHLDGKPMSATKLAQYLEMPRTTVLRKLELLESLKLIVCVKGLYYLDPQRAAEPPQGIVARYTSVIARAIDALGYIPIAPWAKYPKRTPPGL